VFLADYYLADCKKCKNWDGVSDIVCESITCVCENAVVVKCEILSTPRYVCADLRCAFNIDADNKYFKDLTFVNLHAHSNATG
jgi:hypothetical protein